MSLCQSSYASMLEMIRALAYIILVALSRAVLKLLRGGGGGGGGGGGVGEGRVLGDGKENLVKKNCQIGSAHCFLY